VREAEGAVTEKVGNWEGSGPQAGQRPSEVQQVALLAPRTAYRLPAAMPLTGPRLRRNTE
jgi:hypothetical protein